MRMVKLLAAVGTGVCVLLAVALLDGCTGEKAARRLVKGLRSSNRSARLNAGERLVALGPAAVPALIEAVETGSDTVKYIGAQVLGRISDPRATEALIKLLSHRHEHIRAVAAEALGRLGDQRAVGPLVSTLSDPFADVRKEAALGLGHLRAASAIDTLIHVLAEDTDTEVRINAIRSLALIQSRLGTRKAHDGLIDAIEIAAQDLDDNVRYVAVQCLGNMRDRTAVSILIARLNDPNTHIRQESARALSKIGDLRAVEPLTELFSRADADEAKVIETALENLTGQDYELER